MKIAQVGAFTATVATLLTFTYGYSFSDVQTNAGGENTKKSTGLSINEENRIYGGTDGNIDKYPFLASLRDDLLDSFFCGGALISPQYILTAGHCIRTDKIGIIATFGMNESIGDGSGTALQIPVVQGFRHPLYKKKEHLFDVGLLKLETPVDIKPAKIGSASGSDNEVGTMATVLGWGKTENTVKMPSPILKQLTIPVISNAECGKFTKYVGRITEGMMCAGTGNGKDTCNGDSGSPLLVDDDIVIGCVSWGSKCGQQPGVYTRLTYVMDFIEDVMSGGDGTNINVSSSYSSSGSLVSELKRPTDSSFSDLQAITEMLGVSSSSLDAMLELLFGSAPGSQGEDPATKATKGSKTTTMESSSESATGSSSDGVLSSSFESSIGSESGSTEIPATKASKATKSSKTPTMESLSESATGSSSDGVLSSSFESSIGSESGSTEIPATKASKATKSSKTPTMESLSESATGSSSDGVLSSSFESSIGSESGSTEIPATKASKTTKSSKTATMESSSESATGSSSEGVLSSSFESSIGSESGSTEIPATKASKATKGTKTIETEEEEEVPVSKASKASKFTKTPIEDDSDMVNQSEMVEQYTRLMGQAGSVQQKSALRDVLSLRRPNVTATELEEVLRTFCALFPLELQVPDAHLVSSAVAVDVKERRLFDVVHALLQDQTEQSQRKNGRDMTELLLSTFRRIIRWRELYKLCAKCSLKPFLTCLYRPSPVLVLSVLETLKLMLSPCPDFEAGDKAVERSEMANRRSFGDAGGYEVLRSLLVRYGSAVVKVEQKESTAAVLEGVLKLFHLTLVTRRATTDMMTCTLAVGALMNARVSLLDLCHYRESEHNVMSVASGLVKELFCIVDLNQVHELQESAREYGALLYALETAVHEDADFKTIESGAKVNESGERDVETREICVNLVEVFCAGNTRSKKAMYRIFPVDLFVPVKTRADLVSRHTATSPSMKQATTGPGARSARTLPHFSFEFEQPRRISIATSNTTLTNGNVDTKRSRVAGFAYNAMIFGGGAFERWLGDAREKGEHWREIIEAVRRTHESPELVWRASMRAELRQALQAEIEILEQQRRFMAEDEASQSGELIPRWNHEMCYVEYPSIQAELVVNDYFVEYLIPRLADLTTTYEIAEPVVLAWHLSDQLATENDEKWALLCVRCLRLLVRRYAMLFHGQLPMQHVLSLLRDHMNYSASLVRECFLLLNTAIITTRNTPSKSFNQLCSTVTRTIVSVLADPVLLATLFTPFEAENEADQRDHLHFADPEDEAVSVVNERDALIRAGISLLLSIVRRAKFVLRLICSKRMFLCRLLAVETLDHLTITRLLFVLKQLALEDDTNNDFSAPGGSSVVSSHLASAGSTSLHSSSMASQTSSTSDSNWRSLTVVYVLLASCDPKGMGMCVGAAEFLKESCDRPPSSFNDLLTEALGFGGCGMRRLLKSVNPEMFTEIFNSPQKRAADVNWGSKQRVRLYRYLKYKYLGSSDKGSATTWNTLIDDDGNHHEDDDLFISNIFLRSYIEGDGEFLNQWTPEMYSELVTALFEELVLLGHRKSVYTGTGSIGPLPSPPHQPSLSQSSTSSGGLCAAEPWEVQVLILKALARLVPSHCTEVKIKTEFYESLLAPLRRSMLSEVDQVRGILSLDLFVAVLSAPEDRSVNTAACQSFLESKGLSVLSDALERMRNPAFQQILQTVELFGPRQRRNTTTQNMARVLLYRSTDVLSILAKQSAAGIRAITKNPEVVTALIELTSRQIITQYADIDAASVCLSCLGGLCQNDELRALVVNAGGLLSLLDTVAFCPAEELELDKSVAVESQVMGERSESDTSDTEGSQRQHENVDGDETSVSKANDDVESQRIPSRYFGAIRSAALVLRACLGPKNALVPALPTQVLYQLLTPSFVRILRTSPDQFILELQTAEDISSATLIWTVSMRQRLQKCITTELGKVKAAAAANTWPHWNPEHFVAADSFRYQYPELVDVLVLHDVYLANFVATPVEDLDLGDIDMASFSEALLISIQSNENVLRILQERGSSDSAKEAAVRLMRQAMEKLVSTHPQHNLEVAASRGAPVSDLVVSPITSSRFAAEAVAVSNAFSPTDDRDWDITRIERCSSSGIEDLTV